MPVLLIIGGGVAVASIVFGYKAGTGAATGMAQAENKVATGGELLLIAGGIALIVYAHNKSKA